LNVRTAKASKEALREGCNAILAGFNHMLSQAEKVEDAMMEDLALKGAAIELLRRNGLPAAEANFRLAPGEPFDHHVKIEIFGH